LAYIVAPVTRHGETVFHFFSSSVAHAFDLFLWHDVHGFGNPICSVSVGVMRVFADGGVQPRERSTRTTSASPTILFISGLVDLEKLEIVFVDEYPESRLQQVSNSLCLSSVRMAIANHQLRFPTIRDLPDLAISFPYR
jgi:hypothetical protein